MMTPGELRDAEAHEMAQDIRDAREALAEPGERITLEEFERELMTDHATAADKLRQQARVKRDAALLALAEGQVLRAADLHLEAIRLESAANELERAGDGQ